MLSYECTYSGSDEYMIVQDSMKQYNQYNLMLKEKKTTS